MITGRSRNKDIAIAIALGYFALRMADDLRIPLLQLVDLGFHEFGHLLTYPLPSLVTAAAGSFFQIAVPSGLALYFLNRDRAGAALCLGWAATNALDVARYMGDAPYQRLPLLGGGMHDWAFVFGHLHLMSSSHLISVLVRIAAWAMLATAAYILALPYFKAATGERRISVLRTDGDLGPRS